MSTERKNKITSSFVTAIVLAIVLLLLYFCGLSYQFPPPESRQLILIEFVPDESGGGGGGGGGGRGEYSVPRSSVKDIRENPNWSTQISDGNAPMVATNPNSTTPENEKVLTFEPKPEPGATYRPGKGTGTGSGSGSGGGSVGGSGGGTGSGTGMGVGPGSGGGTGGGSGGGIGKGVGHGTGNRNYVDIPNVNINEHGVVYVEVHVNTEGKVISAAVINTPKYPTTITSAQIQEECKKRALATKYVPGKEELRIIKFY